MRNTAVTFSEILILPKFSTVTDLSKIDLSTDLGDDIKLQLPIIGNHLAINMAGGLYLFPKKVYKDSGAIELSSEELASHITELTLNAVTPLRLGITISSAEIDRDKAVACIDAGVEVICVEELFGANQSVVEQVKWLREKYKDNIYIIAGSFVTGQSIIDFKKACTKEYEPNLYKVSSSLVIMDETGIGLPLINAIGDCGRVAPIIVQLRLSDISNTAAKALAQGAKAIQFFESDDLWIRDQYNMEEILQKVSYNLRLACKAVNANTLDEFRKNAELVIISPMSAAEIEYQEG